MNVLQRPRPKEFCATMQGYIIDTDVTITFAVKYGGKIVLEEEYVPDGDYQVRIRKLGQFCELALWGMWCNDEETVWQSAAAGIFTFIINGVEDSQSFVMFSRLQTRKDASNPGWLSEVISKVTYPNAKEYISCMMDNGDTVDIKAYSSDGSIQTALFYESEMDDNLLTMDVSPSVLMHYFPNKDVYKFTLACNGVEFAFLVDHTKYMDLQCFRYKNVYDMPETLITKGGLKLAGNNESETSVMYGISRKFSVKVTDEYTANSGAIMLQSDYKLWHNLLNAQEVEILIHNEWLPIIITKQKFEREFRKGILKEVEFNFRLADPEQNNLIEV